MPQSTISLSVRADQLWVPTDVWVKNGDTLTFQADGTWVDAVIPCSADGYQALLFYRLNLPPRIPDQGRYFKLMGRVVADGVQPEADDVNATFPIGSKCGPCGFRQNGRLFLFANDREGFYWNNWGAVNLTIVQEQG